MLGLIQDLCRYAFIWLVKISALQEKYRAESSEGLISNISDFCSYLSCVKGAKDDYENQDDFGLFISKDVCALAVFDGHGRTGHNVSNFVQTRFLDCLTSETLTRNMGDMTSFLRDRFRACNTECRNHDHSVGNKDKFDAYDSGTTATIAVVIHNILSVASVGDSRCIMGVEKSKDSGKFECVDLTKDHSCDRVDEQKRIKAAGGEVRQLPGDVPFRVFLAGKTYPGLAMTRAIGDASGEDAGIIASPDIIVKKIKRDDGKRRFIVLASDGVWEFLSTEEVIEIVSRFGPSTGKQAVDSVVATALERWKKFCPSAIDDITCIISWLT